MRQADPPAAEVVKLFMVDVDVVSAIRRHGGTEIYQELLDLFYTDGQKRCPHLEELFQEQDWNRYSIDVHGLKSAAANIGADTLSERAKAHEMAANAEDVASLTEHRDELFQCYRAVLDEIQRVLRQLNYGNYGQAADDLPAITAEETTTKVASALQDLEDFHSEEAAAEIDFLLGHAVPSELRAKLEDIRALLKQFDDDKAEDALRAILNVGTH